ncbi:MAG: beta-N-acetylhexosaminidase [Gammaproteobacteria bacterium]|nr:beta-N-acetylhexosaminidase [Gammaproteobacteria bacterium]
MADADGVSLAATGAAGNTVAATQQPLGPLMVDLRGESLTAAEADLLRHPAVGAALLFARNYRSKAQIGELTREIKALRTPPLLLAVDQEGGAVQRLDAGFFPLPAPARLGELYDRDRARARAAATVAGQLMAAEVAQTGIDCSFAPVLDCQNPRSAVIGARAFHRDPAAVAQLAGAFIDGMRRAGMAATLKHFPGHAGVDADSHHRRPVDSRALSAIEKRDLAPFAGLAARAGGVMTAHIQFPRVDHRAPTYSRIWLREILRGRLGFDGMIFSDDLSMAGAADTGNAGDSAAGAGDGAGNVCSAGDGAAADMPARCIAALNAGCDMALVCNDPTGARHAADALGDGYACDQKRLAAMRINASTADPNELQRLAAALTELLPPPDN